MHVSDWFLNYHFTKSYKLFPKHKNLRMLNVIPLDYDAPQNLIVVVGTYGKIKGKVRYG